jgi:Mg2+ and Co2+ transporter CorA
MRRRIARARHLVASHRELFAEIQRPDFMPEKDTGDAELLSAVAQRLDRAGEAVANAREMLIGTFDVHMTRTAQRTNDIMKILTLASVILLPASVVAGVMGMNFRVGFFENPDLFWAVIAGMAAIATGTVGFARWRGWL